MQVIKDFYHEECSNENLKAERWSVDLIDSGKGVYKHNGWGLWLYPIEPSETKFYALDFLQDGSPVSVVPYDKEDFGHNRSVYIYIWMKRGFINQLVEISILNTIPFHLKIKSYLLLNHINWRK